MKEYVCEAGAIRFAGGQRIASVDTVSISAYRSNSVRFAEAPQMDSHFRTLLEALPAAIYTTDADGRITYYNGAAAALWGRRPELGASEWCGSWKLFRADGSPLPHDQCPMALTIKEGRAIRGMEAIAERPDGTRVHFMPFPTPLHDASGALTGAVNMLVDISDRKRDEDAASLLAAIVESSEDAILTKDLDGVITSWNSGADRLFGYTAEEVVGKPVTILIPVDRHNEEPEILKRIRAGQRIDHYETIRRRKDGSLIEISLTVSPIKNAEGTVTGASKIARDITERKRAQQWQKLIFDEMKHRVRNTLATVQAVATQTLRSASTDERAAFLGRLQSFARTHDLLTLESWDRVTLHDLTTRAVEPFQEKNQERIAIEGPKDIWLDANKSLLLAMALHELGTNAVKYGSLSNDDGRVDISWKILPGTPSRAEYCWRESGGPSVARPQREGFGSLLIARTLDNLGQVQLDFDPAGIVCTLLIRL
jgi:two-component system, chemotaxis family, CheB/CheR fusion protein